MKCELCKAAIETTFLGKVVGTHIRDDKGKNHLLCPKCQRNLPTREEMLKHFP